MNEDAEFSVSGFKRHVRSEHRSDKGKRHNYPKERMRFCKSSNGV